MEENENDSGKTGNNLNIDKLQASKCKCNSVSVPPSKFCHRCKIRPEIFEIPSRGSVLSFTLLHVTAKGFSSPLGIAIVELTGGAKIMCNTENDRILNIGEDVKIVQSGERLYISD